MADQLFGVLREVVAAQTGSVEPAPSTLFTSELRGALGRTRLDHAPGAARRVRRPGAGFLAAIAGVTDARRARVAARAGAGANRRGEVARGAGCDRRRALRRRRRPARRGRGGRSVGLARRLVPRPRLPPRRSAHRRARRVPLGVPHHPGRARAQARARCSRQRAPASSATRHAGTTSCRAPIPTSPPPRSGWRGAASPLVTAPARSRRSTGFPMHRSRPWTRRSRRPRRCSTAGANDPALADLVAAGAVVAQLPPRERGAGSTDRRGVPRRARRRDRRTATRRPRPPCSADRSPSPTSVSGSRTRTERWPARRRTASSGSRSSTGRTPCDRGR